MRYCPRCGRAFDDASWYCSADSTALAGGPPVPPGPPAPAPAAPAAPPPSPRAVRAGAIVAVASLALLVLAGLALYLVFRVGLGSGGAGDPCPGLCEKAIACFMSEARDGLAAPARESALGDCVDECRGMPERAKAAAARCLELGCDELAHCLADAERLGHEAEEEHPRPESGEAEVNLARIAALVEEYSVKSAATGASFTVGIGSGEPVAAASFPRTGRTSYCEGYAGQPRVNAESVPRDPRAVQRRKYLPTESAWTCADASSGCAGDTAWAQMHFAVTQPMRYVYCYQAQGSGEGQTFTVFASGDLDGDDVWSQYSRAGIIAAGRPIIGPLIVDNEGE